MASDPDPVSVIVPARNEAASIAAVLAELHAVLDAAGIQAEIVVVDDGSTDGTGGIAEGAGARVIHHPEGLGYGAALKTGLRRALHERIVIIDGDGSYPAQPIPGLLAALAQCEMAVGTRDPGSQAVPLVRRPARWVVGLLARYVTGRSIPDFNSGLRAFRRDLPTRYLGLLPNGFSFTTTITVAALCDGMPVSWQPITYRRRSGRSKLVPAHFFVFLMLVFTLSTFFRPLKVFLPIAGVALGLGATKLVMDVAGAARAAGGVGLPLVGHEVVSATAVIFLTSGLQVLLMGMVADALARRSTWGRSGPRAAAP